MVAPNLLLARTWASFRAGRCLRIGDLGAVGSVVWFLVFETGLRYPRIGDFDGVGALV